MTSNNPNLSFAEQVWLKDGKDGAEDLHHQNNTAQVEHCLNDPLKDERANFDVSTIKEESEEMCDINPQNIKVEDIFPVVKTEWLEEADTDGSSLTERNKQANSNREVNDGSLKRHNALVKSSQIDLSKKMNKVPGTISDKAKRMMTFERSMFDEDSDENIDSEDSFALPDEDDLIVSSDENDSDSNDDTTIGYTPYTPIYHNGKRRSCEDVSPVTLIGEDDVFTQASLPQEDDLQVQGSQAGSFHGNKKCFTWNRFSSVRQTVSSNDIIRRSSLHGPALQLGSAPTPAQVWKLLFTPIMSEEIVRHTNAKLAQMRRKLRNENALAYKDIDKQELDAFFAIILFCSIFKSPREQLKSLFSPSVTGRPLFRGVMTENRCCTLFRALRFDDPVTRTARSAEDKAACISGIFHEFIFNSQNNCSLGRHCTIDETLVPFRGKVSFKMYSPNKPAKAGIKIMCLTDAYNTYLYDAYIHTGKGSYGASLSPEEKDNLSIPSQSVIRLTRSIAGTNKNVTIGNRFSSVKLAEELLKRGLTMVGKLKRNQPQIPPEFQPNSFRAVGSNLYGYTPEMTLLSHVTKKNKAVILLSTMHHAPSIDPLNQKPEMISFYNTTKCGVDNFDQKCSIHSANRRTQRWPLAVFYYMMAACSVNTFTLYEMFPHAEVKTRFQFVHDLAMGLARAHVQRRLLIPNLPTQLMRTIEEIAGVESSSDVRELKSDLLPKRKLCRYCPYQKNRCTRFKCIKCDTPTCGEHSKKLCNSCLLV